MLGFIGNAIHPFIIFFHFSRILDFNQLQMYFHSLRVYIYHRSSKIPKLIWTNLILCAGRKNVCVRSSVCNVMFVS